MASVLFGIGGALRNAITFSGTNNFSCKLTDLGEKERKRHDLVLEKSEKTRDEWNKDFIFSVGGCVKETKQRRSEKC